MELLTGDGAESSFPGVARYPDSATRPADLLGQAARIHAAIREGVAHESDGGPQLDSEPQTTGEQGAGSRPKPRRRRVTK